MTVGIEEAAARTVGSRRGAAGAVQIARSQSPAIQQAGASDGSRSPRPARCSSAGSACTTA